MSNRINPNYIPPANAADLFKPPAVVRAEIHERLAMSKAERILNRGGHTWAEAQAIARGEAGK